jgi:hypothetical protein
MLVLPVFSQENITEKVEIDYWILPLFAVDKAGNSVVDLKPEDINLRINNQRVTDFTLYRSTFSVEEKVVQPGDKEPPPELKKKKLVFLLFDIAFTTSSNYEQSKQIAKDLVQKADKDTLFTVIGIDPLSGPVYAGGPLSDKQQVIKLIDEKIEWDPQTKSISTVIFLANSTQSAGKFSRLDGQDLAHLTEQRSSGLRKSNMNYFMAFQTLYHALNSIKDNKFIYLFSEGVSLYARKAVQHAEEEYWAFLKKTADFLGQSGAVLFIINPTGASRASNALSSGEDSLRYMARQSGGKYIEGVEKHISNQIQMMHRAYYEIAFPDRESFEGALRRLAIRSRRSGVSVHTLRSLEKSKQYGDMKDIEKEILALNLLNPSPLFRAPVKALSLKIAKKSETEGQIKYKINLPSDFSRKSVDLYKIWLNETTHQASVVKESIVTTDKLDLTLNKKGNTVPRIILVNAAINAALVQGIFDAKVEKNAILSDAARNFTKEVKRMNQNEAKELKRVKEGAAIYCMKLEEAAFHYICKETVSEVLEVLRTHKAVREAKYDSTTDSYRAGFKGQDDRRVVKRKVTNKYVNDYQLISNKGQAHEQRKLIDGTMKTIAGKDKLLKIDSFITRKISLSPLSLLGLQSQDKFLYRFLKHEKVKGVKCAVIECFPKDTSGIKSVYGKIWIDLSDFSIMQVSINPVSIGGYGNLLKLARYYKSKLVLSCDFDFYLKRDGIRFPTKVLIRETYSGGSQLRSIVKKSVWERSKTTYTFDDYKFFDVAATSKEEEMEK